MHSCDATLMPEFEGLPEAGFIPNGASTRTPIVRSAGGDASVVIAATWTPRIAYYTGYSEPTTGGFVG
jgi:hypothetical protein